MKANRKTAVERCMENCRDLLKNVQGKMWKHFWNALKMLFNPVNRQLSSINNSTFS